MFEGPSCVPVVEDLERDLDGEVDDERRDQHKSKACGLSSSLAHAG